MLHTYLKGTVPYTYTGIIRNHIYSHIYISKQMHSRIIRKDIRIYLVWHIHMQNLLCDHQTSVYFVWWWYKEEAMSASAVDYVLTLF